MQRYLSGAASPLGDREVGVIVCSAVNKQPARDGNVVDPRGLSVRLYRANPIVLFSHDPDSPVGTTTAIGLDGEGNLAARILFAPEGASPLADQICSLTRAGVLAGVSIGFEVDESEPLDPRHPRGGQLVTKSSLLEISVCSVPADAYALVVERSVAGMPRRAFAALRPVPAAAMQRAAARLPRARGKPPLSYAGHVWALQEQRRREEEAQYGREARRANLERMRQIGESYRLLFD